MRTVFLYPNLERTDKMIKIEERADGVHICGYVNSWCYATTS